MSSCFRQKWKNQQMQNILSKTLSYKYIDKQNDYLCYMEITYACKVFHDCKEKLWPHKSSPL